MTAAEVRETAEHLAARLIRSAIARGDGVNIDRISEQTALTPVEVGRIRDQVASGRREHKTLGRGTAPAPATTPPVPQKRAAPAPAEVPDLLTERPDDPPSLARARAKARTAVAELHTALDIHQRKQELAAKATRLQAQLDQVQAQLDQTGHVCDVCGKQLGSRHGLNIHRTRLHREVKR